MANSINKDHYEPAYAQLAGILRRQIAQGVYPPGARLPAESAIGKKYGLSPMTVRQAIGVLTQQGLLERVQGMGTFVKTFRLTESSFDLEGLREIFNDPRRTRVKMLQLALTRADAAAAAALALQPGAKVILLRRLLLHDERPALCHTGYVRCEPTRPVVEEELGLGPLSDLFNGHGGKTAKKGELTLDATLLSIEDAALLGRPAGSAAFRMEYTVYDFEDIPFGSGWLTVLPDIMKLKTRLGLWEGF